MLRSFVCFAVGEHRADFVIRSMFCQAAYLQNEQAQRSEACRVTM